MKIIMLGAPGAGKGTQAKMIAEKYHLPHVSTGDIFRANLKQGTELGKKAKEYMDKGALVPDELTVEILLDRVAQDDCKDGYVLDGFPRTIPQAEVLDRELEKLGDHVDLAIDVEVPDANIVKRMSGRRACLKCTTGTPSLLTISSTSRRSRRGSAMSAARSWCSVTTTSRRRCRRGSMSTMSRPLR